MEELKGIDGKVKTTSPKKANKRAKPRRERIKLWGNNLDAALKEKDNMPDIELADLVGTTPAHICRIKSNQTSSISLPIAMKIARVLGKPVESLWILDNPNPQPEKKKSK